MESPSDENELDHRSWITGKPLERYWDLHGALFQFAAMFDWEEPNDRAIVIVGASFLDLHLEQMLLNFLADEKEAEKLIRPDGALGSFGNRVTMAYCLGMIPDVIRDDLRLIGKVRNQFAHRLDASFEDTKIRSWCESLQWHRLAYMPPPPSATTRDLYQVGVHQLVTYLSGMVGLARQHRCPIRPNPFP